MDFNRLVILLRGFFSRSVVVFTARAMVVEHTHGVLQVVESIRIYPSDLLVSDSFTHDQLVQVLGRRVLGCSQQLAYLNVVSLS